MFLVWLTSSLGISCFQPLSHSSVKYPGCMCNTPIWFLHITELSITYLPIFPMYGGFPSSQPSLISVGMFSPSCMWFVYSGDRKGRQSCRVWLHQPHNAVLLLLVCVCVCVCVWVWVCGCGCVGVGVLVC